MPDGKSAINRKENMSIFTPHPTLREESSTTITPSTLPSLMRLPNVPCSPSLTHSSPSTRLMLPSTSWRMTQSLRPQWYSPWSIQDNSQSNAPQNPLECGGLANYDGWYWSQRVPVQNKDDLSDPNKWCGVMLMDVCSKIFSYVMTRWHWHQISIRWHHQTRHSRPWWSLHTSAITYHHLLLCQPCQGLKHCKSRPAPSHSWGIRRPPPKVCCGHPNHVYMPCCCCGPENWDRGLGDSAER